MTLLALAQFSSLALDFAVVADVFNIHLRLLSGFYFHLLLLDFVRVNVSEC